METLVKVSLLVLVASLLYILFGTSRAPPKVQHEFVAPGWQRVADTFREQVESGSQRGGAFAVYHKGKLVVDVAGGFADDEISLEWSENTVSQFFSTTKAVAAMVMAMLVDRGLLDYKKPVSKYWPEFAANGKKDITVEQLLSHQAGLALVEEPFELTDLVYNDNKISKIFASQKPLWKVGENHGYHALTIGIYEDQLVKRVDPKRRSLSQFFQEEVAKPFGIEFFIGLPKKEHYRCARNVNAEIYLAEIPAAIRDMLFMWSVIKPGTLLSKILASPKGLGDITVNHNWPYWRQVPSPATHGFGTASAVSKLFGILANGGKLNQKTLLSDKNIKALQEPLTDNGKLDLVVNLNITFGRGVAVWPSDSPGQYMFGADGAGGQVGISDPHNKLGIAYVTNHMFRFIGRDRHYKQLSEAVYKTLQEL